MKIDIRVIAHVQQRYATCGDYWGAYGPLQTQHIRVSSMGDVRFEFLMALHELVESFLCAQRAIAEPDIKAFDEAHLDDSDPGALPAAPYHREHMFAEHIERQVAEELGVDWAEYSAAIEALFE